MAIRITCPSCNASYSVDDDKRGKKIRCRECDEPITVPASKKRESESVQESRKVKVNAGRRRDADDDEDDEAPQSRKNKAAAKSGMPAMLLVGGAAVVLFFVLVAGASVGGYFLLRRDADQPAPLAQDGDAKHQHGNVPFQQPDPNAGKELPDQLAKDRVLQVKQATAYLRVTMPNGQVAEGTGFFAFEPGIVITNAHVLGMLPSSAQPPREVEVVVNSGEPNERKMIGTVLGVLRANDLAVLRVPPGNLPAPLRVETERDLVETQRVYIFGFPFGAQLGKNITVSESSVTRLAKDASGAVEQIQVNGGMHPGNSGGPVVNTFGNVVGVSVAVIRGTQINFAIPSEKVRLLMEGQLADSRHGEAYQQGGLTRLPVKFTCLDPLSRIREMKVEVWTGPAGPPRPYAFKQPPPQAGDGPRQTHVIAYQNGVGSAEVALPAVGPGQVCWVQPVLTTAKGVHWGPAQPTPLDLAPLQRLPANLFVSLTTQKERTARMSSEFTLTLQAGKKKTVINESTRAELLEVVLPENQGGRNIGRIRTSYADLDINVSTDGRNVFIPDHQKGLSAVRTMPPVFIIDETNATFGYIATSLKQGNPLRELVDEFNGMVHNPFEATAFKMPNRIVQPLESFPSKSTMMMRAAGGQKPGDKKTATIVDLMLTCTYEGMRVRGGRQEAVITVVGNMQGRKELIGKIQGNITGKIGFDVAGGFVSSARIRIAADQEEDIPGLGAFQQSTQQDINVDRVAGNPRNLSLAPDKQPGPGPGPGPGPVLGKGKVLRNVNGTLTNVDPIDPGAKGTKTHMKTYPVSLQAGKTYVISMNSAAFDTYLRLEYPAGKTVAEDDDSGGDLNARIVYRAAQSGVHRVIATSYKAGATGPFQLTVQEAD